MMSVELMLSDACHSMAMMNYTMTTVSIEQSPIGNWLWCLNCTPRAGTGYHVKGLSLFSEKSSCGWTHLLPIDRV